jgi:hypothetical protein
VPGGRGKSQTGWLGRGKSQTGWLGRGKSQTGWQVESQTRIKITRNKPQGKPEKDFNLTTKISLEKPSWQKFL